MALALVGALARADVPATQRAALMSFYIATNGPLWPPSTSQGWGQGDPCDSSGPGVPWAGVTCNAANSDIVGLDVDAGGLSGTLPDAISNLYLLTYLDVSENKLNGTIPPALFTLTLLQYLDLGQNSFACPIPEAVGVLTALTYLGLVGNNLTPSQSWVGTIPDSVTRLTQLTYLSIGFSDTVVGTVPSGLTALKALQCTTPLLRNAST